MLPGPPPRSGDRGEGLVEFDEVVGGGDQSPFGAGGGAAASGEAGEAAVVFGVTEDRLDQLFALRVELVTALGRERVAHEVIGAAGPAGPGAAAAAGVGRDQHRDAIAGDLVHLF